MTTLETLDLSSEQTTKFYTQLQLDNYSAKTITIIRDSLNLLTRYLKTSNIVNYREFLINTYAPSTVNLRVYALNKYLKYLDINYHMKSVPNQRAKTLEKVISLRNYEKLRDYFKGTNLDMYYALKVLAGTGIRPSELFKLRVSDVKRGYADLYSKRNKQRRIYFPKELQKELLTYKTNGNEMLFTFKMHQLRYAIRQGARLGISRDVLHPYSFRHLFGKTFLKRSKNLTLLADLMGHESLETTRIYTRLTREEQQREVNRCVDWF